MAESNNPMSEEHRKIIRYNYVLITQDLQADQVIQNMKKVYSEREEADIKSMTTEQKRAEKMMDILPRKGDRAFPLFLEALKPVQPWIARHLAGLAGLNLDDLASRAGENESIGMKQVHRDILRKYTEMFSSDLDVVSMVKKLVETSVLNDITAEEIKHQESQRCQVEMLFEKLPKCAGPEAFEKFYKCLKSIQPAFAYEWKKMVEISHPGVLDVIISSDQESHTKASSDVDMVTSHSSSVYNFSIFSPCGELPEQVHQLLQNTLDKPDELFDNDWKLLYKEFGLPPGKEEVIMKKGGSPTDHVMKYWIKANGNNATVRSLLHSLKKCNHGDLVSKIEEILGVEYKAEQNVVDGVSNVNLEDNKPVKLIKDIPERLKPSLVGLLEAVDKEILARMATKMAKERIYICDASDFLEKTKTLRTRFLFRELRKQNKHGIVQWMRDKLPTGSTGPLKYDDETRANDMKYLDRHHLTRKLTVNEEWQIVAGHVGLKVDDIKYIAQKSKEPAEDVLSYWEVRANTTVGALYDVFVDCGFYVIADML